MDLKIWMMPLIASGNKVMRRGYHSERKQSAEKWGSSHGPYGLLQPTAGKAKIQLSCDQGLPEQGLSLCTFQLFTWKCSKQTIVKQLYEKGAMLFASRVLGSALAGSTAGLLKVAS